MKKRKTNFVDDVKVAQPIRRSRSSSVDLINGQDQAADLGHLEEHLNLLSFGKIFSAPPLTAAPGPIAVSPTTITAPSTTPTSTQTEGCASLTEVSNTNTGPGGTRTQVFQVGPVVNDGFTYTLEVYSHPVTVSASGDSPSTIASKLAAAVNGTSAGQWNSVGTAPNAGINGFPPKASSSGDTVTVTLNYQNQFGGQGTGCYQAPPPPPPPPPPAPTTATVDAGPDQQIKLPTTTATIQGAVSGPITYSSTWSYISGPQGATPSIVSPGSIQTSVSSLTLPGDYTFKLTAKNSVLIGQSTEIGSDTVVVTVLSPDIPAPASNSTIDGWDCATLNQYLSNYNTLLSDSSISSQTRTNYENALLYINNRIKTSCSPSSTPTIDTTTGAPPPLPTVNQIDGMNCDQLLALKTSLTTNDAAYRTDATTLQNFINTSNYVDLQFTQKCKNPNPTAPTVEVYAPGAMPYGRPSGGGGGGGSSSSAAAPKPTAQNYKRWWWIGLVVVAAALLLYKPGTKVGSITK